MGAICQRKRQVKWSVRELRIFVWIRANIFADGVNTAVFSPSAHSQQFKQLVQ